MPDEYEPTAAEDDAYERGYNDAKEELEGEIDIARSEGYDEGYADAENEHSDDYASGEDQGRERALDEAVKAIEGIM